MLVVLVVLCPPLAVLLTAPSQTAKSFALTLLLYVPGVLHARSTVEQYRAHRQYASLMRVLDGHPEPAKSLRAA
ncbi:YqaE/Pmp3 family membrane protein [Gemmata sp. G18]|uniref:YqaE/Pmp3 family membrane protein n=1 Tax=Gemmata palustris TaxID=2822762 RepID=A0ABS5BUL5_9BACT|nr:YqaE/Pmp3 family membrane protein [Gemmata palustris]MBP3957404.1 YqaE/Pmp3 family membrane protein [Gemmata palustris]